MNAERLFGISNHHLATIKSEALNLFSSLFSSLSRLLNNRMEFKEITQPDFISSRRRISSLPYCSSALKTMGPLSLSLSLFGKTTETERIPHVAFPVSKNTT